MSTRSIIALEIGPNQFKSVYCHWDGYPSFNGIMLMEYYKSLDKVNELLSYGDMSFLGKRINPLSKEHSFNNPESGTTVYYGRDRGEKGTDFKISNSSKIFCEMIRNSDADYVYIAKPIEGINEVEWYVSSYPNYDNLFGKAVKIMYALPQIIDGMNKEKYVKKFVEFMEEK